MEPGLVDDVRNERHEDAVEPGSRGPDGDQRVHVGRAMARARQARGRTGARPDLDDRGRDEREPVDGLHRDLRLRDEHRDHDRERDPDRDHRLTSSARVLALGDGCRPPKPSAASVGAGAVAVRARSDVVPGGLDGATSRRDRRRGQIADRGDSVARLTRPPRRHRSSCRKRSMRLTHEAQVMPSIGQLDLGGRAGSG